MGSISSSLAAKCDDMQLRGEPVPCPRAWESCVCILCCASKALGMGDESLACRELSADVATLPPAVLRLLCWQLLNTRRLGLLGAASLGGYPGCEAFLRRAARQREVS